jgi:hypothetical protein
MLVWRASSAVLRRLRGGAMHRERSSSTVRGAVGAHASGMPSARAGVLSARSATLSGVEGARGGDLAQGA